jgi:hypothetical protein
VVPTSTCEEDCRAREISGASDEAIIDLHIPANGPTRFPQPPFEGRDAGELFWIICGQAYERADPSHRPALLRSHRKRPRRNASETRDE